MEGSQNFANRSQTEQTHMNFSRRQLLSASALTAVLMTSGCGFRLRGSASLPFDTIFVDTDLNGQLGAQLARQLRSGSNVRLVHSAEEAQAVLRIIENSRQRDVIAYNSKGNASEYELGLTVAFNLRTPAGDEMLPDTVLKAQRSLSYNDSELLSHEAEEATIYREMLSDLVSQMMRRLEKAKMPEPKAEENKSAQ